jgi:phosphoribosylanthranilate isomerase
MKGRKIKICGMRDPDNILEISSLLPDYIGFIFYPGSLRFAGNLPPEIRAEIPAFIKKVGVFVNEDEEKLVETCSAYGIGTVQLHGDESPGYCENLVEKGLRIIKVFNIGKNLNTNIMEPFQEACSYFLLDTASAEHGGSGQKFDWNLLEEYDLEIPFFLSGGIGPDDARMIREMEHPMLFGVDINSLFETSPGFKDMELCEKFIGRIRGTINE